MMCDIVIPYRSHRSWFFHQHDGDSVVRISALKKCYKILEYTQSSCSSSRQKTKIYTPGTQPLNTQKLAIQYGKTAREHAHSQRQYYIEPTIKKKKSMTKTYNKQTN